jgi:hypothetical protein
MGTLVIGLPLELLLNPANLYYQLNGGVYVHVLREVAATGGTFVS